MAYERENECKHIAALAFSLRESAGPAATSRLPKNDDDNGPLPFVFEKCAHAPPVLAWLERSGVEARAVPYVSQYASLHDWWRSSRTNAGARNLRAAIRLAAPLVEKKLDALRDFVPPEMPRDGTAYAELYAALHRLHMRVRDRAVVLGAPPWPLEGGVLGDHPGFEVELDTRRWTLRLRERSPYRAKRRRSTTLRLLAGRSRAHEARHSRPARRPRRPVRPRRGSRIPRDRVRCLRRARAPGAPRDDARATRPRDRASREQARHPRVGGCARRGRSGSAGSGRRTRVVLRRRAELWKWDRRQRVRPQARQERRPPPSDQGAARRDLR